MAVALEPALLLADEPTTALDPATERAVIGLLERLRRDRGMAVVLITHDMQLAGSASDRVLRMREGRLDPPGALRRERGPETSPLRGPPAGGRLVEVRALSKTFARRGFSGSGAPVKALDSVSMDIRAGEILGVVGPSGSGKTTLGRCLAGMERFDSGTVRLGGVGISAPHRIGRLNPVQVVYQNPFASLNPLMPVGDAIGEGLRSRRMPRRERRERVMRLLSLVGLADEHYGRLPNELSGGERQRAVIARTVAAEPRLLVADEPTASLDESTGMRILGLLARLAHERGLAVLLISHDRRAIVRIADRVMVLANGALQETSKTAPNAISYPKH